ncbi:unnamed protein product [Sympodiomycopsis kandeliae]
MQEDKHHDTAREQHDIENVRAQHESQPELQQPQSSSSSAVKEEGEAGIHDHSDTCHLYNDRSQSSQNPLLKPLDRLSALLARYSVEAVSVSPIPRSKRIDKRWWSIALLWFSANFNILSFSTGSLIAEFPMSPTAAYCTIIFFSLFSSLFPAYFLTWGPKLGLRQMIHTRYSWGYFAPIIALLNAASLCGYTILNFILGGQTLSAVSPGGRLTPTVGIVIVAVITLVIAFAGIRVLHLVERWLWVPTLIAFCILAGLAGSGPDGLHFPAETPKTETSNVLAMASIILGFLVSWSALGSDTSLYFDPDTTPSLGLFLSTFAAFFLGSCPLFLLGASFALSTLDNPVWSDALSQSNGALFDLVMSSKAGGFGHFVTVILALSIIGNTSASVYSFGLSMPAILPPLARLPRFIFPLVIMAIVIPLAIVGADVFYDTLTSFTSILSYWVAPYVSSVLVDHIVIRRRRFESYDTTIWNQWSKLPIGLAAIGSALLSLAVIIPAVEQTWFTGPIAKKIGGDFGFELGFVVCAILYAPLRLLELKFFGR